MEQNKRFQFWQASLMVRSWSGKKSFCELLKILRLVEISVLFGLILSCLWCCLGVTCGWVCVSKWGIGCRSQRWFHHVPAVLGLALMEQLCLSFLVPSNSLARVAPALPLPGTSEGSAVLGVIQLLGSSQKHRAMETGTMHSSLQHFCPLSAPHARPPGALGEAVTASVHNAPFTVKYAAVTPQHLQNLSKEADKHTVARG